MEAASKPAIPIPEEVTRRPGSIVNDQANPINAHIKYNVTTTNVPRFHSSPVIFDPPIAVLTIQTLSKSCTNDDVSNKEVKTLHPCPFSTRPGTNAPNAVNVLAPGPINGLNTRPSNDIQYAGVYCPSPFQLTCTSSVCCASSSSLPLSLLLPLS